MSTAPPCLKDEQQQCRGGGGGGGGCGVVQAIAMLVATAVTAQAAYRARREPWDIAFVLFSYAALALLFLCLSVYERLPQPAADEDGAAVRRRRRWLKMAVWALSTALSAAFAWRVAAVMPAPALKAAVWGMTSTVAVAGFCLLFVYRPAAISSYSELYTCKNEAASPKLHQIV